LSNRQTNNSYFLDKVALRKSLLDKNCNYIVLDCFSGTGNIWKKIEKDGYKVQVVSIDKKESATIKGDNIKVLPSLDLQQFDIIDLDAYGVPFNQLEIILSKNLKNKVIFFTFIQTMFGRLNKKMLNVLGYTNIMINKVPSLFNKNGFQKFCQYLSKKRIDKVYYICHNNKYYGYFKINPE